MEPESDGSPPENDALENLPVSAISNGGTAILQRLFESGAGAFSLSDIGELIATPESLREKLDALDDTPNNVSLTQTQSETRFDLQVSKTLSGTVDVDLNAFDGRVAIGGSLTASANIDLRLSFGVDADGFFIDTSHFAEPELAVNSLSVEGDLAASGNFGFVQVTLSGATLDLAPEVGISLDLIEPGADPFSGNTDGRLRLYDLSEASTSLLSVTVNGSEGMSDLSLMATLAVDAFLPNSNQPISVFTASPKFVWDDISSPLAVRMEFDDDDTATGLLRNLLDIDFKPLFLNMLEQVDLLGDEILEVRALDAPLPVMNSSVNDLLTSPDSAGVGDLLRLHDPVEAYFDEADANEEEISMDGLLEVMIRETARKIDGSQLGARLTHDENGSQLLFDIQVEIQPSFQSTLDFASLLIDDQIDINASADVGATGNLDFDVTLGIDLSNIADGLDSSDYYILVNDLSADLLLDAKEIDAGIEVGNQTAGIDQGQVMLHGGATVTARLSRWLGSTSTGHAVGSSW